jgi:hypothetical protein
MAKHLNETTPKKIFSSFSFSLMLAVPLMPIQAGYRPALAEASKAEFWAATVDVTEYQCPFCMFDEEWNAYPVGVKHPDDSARDLAAQLSPIAGDDHIKLVVNDEATNAGTHYAIKITKRNTL